MIVPLSFKENGTISKVQVIVNSFVADIEKGALRHGDKLPSINEFSEKNNVGRDTIEKAYKQLKRIGIISSYPSRGYFVASKDGKKPKVLLILDELSSTKNTFYEQFVKALPVKIKIDIQVHNGNSKLFTQILEANIGKYDRYVAIPNFEDNLLKENYIKILKKIPSHELIILGNPIPEMRYSCKAIFQDYEKDINELLQSSIHLIKKYKSIVISEAKNGSFRGISNGVRRFCSAKKIRCRGVRNFASLKLKRGELYIAVDDENVAHLIKSVRYEKLNLGQDIGIISLNDTALNELLNITVITTDFVKMGHNLSRLILRDKCVQYENPCQMIYRASL